MKQIDESQGTYSHIFVYRIRKTNHKALLNLQERLRAVYKKHGMLGSKIYQLGKSNVFEGFDSFEKTLVTKDNEEVWIEVDTYENGKEFARIVAEIGQDADAGPLWGELAQLTSDHHVIMGEFELLSRV
ncbi:MAG TPA: hypothetical protein VED17_07225 [Nitrososphaerales archaeon]|nr:hypothetical protein [Nitrososphaerales archaeon]